MEDKGSEYDPEGDEEYVGPKRISNIGLRVNTHFHELFLLSLIRIPVHFLLSDFADEDEDSGGGCEDPRGLGLRENVFDVRGPNLSGQYRRVDYGVEGDFLEEGRGWQGPYVSKLSKKQRREQPLGERSAKTYWNQNKKWAIELGFKVSFQAIFNSHLTD